MKNRKMPYGYVLRNGTIRTEPEEAENVRRIFAAYLNGNSLKEIAEILTRQQIAYLPGETAWNKNRVSRLLANSAYGGEGGYPPIIDKNTVASVKHTREGRNTQKGHDPSALISPGAVAITCGLCGSPVRRTCNHRTAYRQKYGCDACGREFRISDGEMHSRILLLLRHANIRTPESTRDSLETRRMENEIKRLFDAPDIDIKVVRQCIFDLAAAKYRLLTEGLAITDKLRTDLAPANLSSCNIRKTVRETVKKISLTQDGRIELTLINDQVLKEEHPDGTTRLGENSDHADAGHLTGEETGVA